MKREWLAELQADEADEKRNVRRILLPHWLAPPPTDSALASQVFDEFRQRRPPDERRA